MASRFRLMRRCFRFLQTTFIFLAFSASLRSESPFVSEELSFGSWQLTGGVSGVFDNEKKPVVSLEYQVAKKYFGLNPWLGIGWATDGAIFAGGGVAYRLSGEGPWSVLCGAGPGYYERKEGLELGSHFEIYSFAEVAYRFRADHFISLRLGHISNGGIVDRNPGTELITLGCTLPWPSCRGKAAQHP